MEEACRKIKSKFYNMMNIAPIVGFYLGGAMQLYGMSTNNDQLIKAGICTTLLSGGYYLGRKFAKKQFKKASDLENRLE